jgi:hypothetical protein
MLQRMKRAVPLRLKHPFIRAVWRGLPRPPQHLERNENLPDLAPKGSLVAAEAFECPIVEIGKPQETSPDLGIDCLGRFLRVASIALSAPFAVSTGTVAEPDGLENAMVRRLGRQCVLGLTLDFALNLEKTSFSGCGTAQPP